MSKFPKLISDLLPIESCIIRRLITRKNFEEKVNIVNKRRQEFY